MSRLFKVSLLLMVLCAIGCAKSANFFRVSDLQWKADAIQFALHQTDTVAGREQPHALDVDCLNCNLIEPASEARIDSLGTVHVQIPEANYLVSAVLHVSGRGIDTVLQIKQRSRQEAESFYKLSRPLIGRILVSQFSILYSDSAMTEIGSHAETGDELNMLGENDLLFFVHHPLFKSPLYLPKSSGIRLY